MRQETRFASTFSRPAAAALYLLAVLLVASAAALALIRAHRDRLALTTGPAEWIWYGGGEKEPRPLRFYATGDFALAENPSRATAKVFVDHAHVLFVNGERVGAASQRPGDPLALYDVARWLRRGQNRVAIEAASPSGIGGILFSLDLDGYGRDAFGSSGRWRVDPSPAAVREGGRYRPQVWGKPPRYPWGFPRMPRPDERQEGPGAMVGRSATSPG